LIIESVAAAGMILQQINTVIQNVNEGKANVQQAMALLSDFGQGLNEFQSTRQASTFKPLSNNDVLKLQMIRRSQERYEKDLRDLLLVADPKLLEDYDAAIKENKRQHREHLQLMAKKRKQKERLMAQLAVTAMTLIIGGGLAVGIIALVIKAYG
tara:strand:- start:49 stop:513 length:465 start_codon:yes stop_codon:yes gene_type:complete